MKNNPIVKFVFWKDVFLDWSIIILCYFWLAYTSNIFVTIAAITIIGLEQYRLFVLFHDLQHRTIFKKKKTNYIIGNLLIGWSVGVDIHSFNRFHGNHHAHNGSMKDPEIRDSKDNPMIKAVGRWDLPMTPLKILFWFTMEVIFGPILAIMFVLGIKIRTNSDNSLEFRWGECIGPGLFIASIFSICYMLDALWIMAIWYLSFGFVFNAVFNLRMLTEHLGCAKGETFVLAEPKNWYEWLYAVTSGAHNIRYHLEHHNNSKIPYMLLPEKRKENLAANVKTVRLKDAINLLATSTVIKSGEIFEKGDPRSIIYRASQL